MSPVPSERRLMDRGSRYTVVGLICALTNYLAMLAVDFLGGNYPLGIFVGFLVVTPLGYVLHSCFTFAEPLSGRAFLRFAATVIAAYPLATALLVVLCSGLRLSVAIAYPIAVLGMFAWNFVAAQWAILPQFGIMPTMMLRALSAKHKRREEA